MESVFEEARTFDMPKIYLEPGENFAHSHRFASQTTLESGTATIQIGPNSEEPLSIGRPVRIEAGVEHVLRNVGAQRAVVDCGACDPTV